MGVGLQAKSWRFVCVAPGPGEGDPAPAITILDKIASDRHVEILLNVPNFLSFTVPSDNPLVNIIWPGPGGDPYIAEGNRLIYAFRQENLPGTGPPDVPYYTCRAAGTILQIEDTAEQDNATSRVVAFDPWKIAYARPAQNDLAYLPTPMGVWDGIYPTGTPTYQIVLEQLKNTIDINGFLRVDAGDGSRIMDGPQYQNWGGTEYYEGTIDATIDLADPYTITTGQTVGDVWAAMVNAAYMDIVLTPIYDPVRRPGYTHEMNIYTQAGVEQDNDIFGWDRPPHSLVQLSRMIDGTQRANIIDYGVGQGASGGTTTPVSDTASITKYGEYWAQQFLTGNQSINAVTAMAQLQLALRKDGRTTIQMSPTPNRSPAPFVEYNLGDRVPVYATGSKFRQDLLGFVRIYGFPIDISDDALEEVNGMILVPQAS